MKLTKSQLKQLIKEELRNIMQERLGDLLVIPKNWRPHAQDRRAFKKLLQVQWRRCMEGRDIYCSATQSIKVGSYGSEGQIDVYKGDGAKSHSNKIKTIYINIK